MHDWTLKEINYDWQRNCCALILKDSNSSLQKIFGVDIEEFKFTHKEEWGPSSSINEVIGPIQNGHISTLKIEMQSGDVITMHAKQIRMPTENS